MDTKTLRLFICLAEKLHFGRASESCFISPSALSRSIKGLEQEVGVKLFNRDNRSVTLTHHGSVLLQYARETISQWELTRDSLLETAQDLHGEISMYCSVTASYSFLYEILSTFRKNFPRIGIKLHTGDPDNAISRVMSGQEDISIAAKPDSLPKGLSSIPIAMTPLEFIAPISSKNSSLPRNQKQEIHDWHAIPMILPESGVGRNRLNEWFRNMAVQPRIYAQVSGNEAIVSMVALGFGIGVVPRLVVENSPLAKQIYFINVSPKLAPYEVCLFTQEKKLRSPLIRAFWSQLATQPGEN